MSQEIKNVTDEKRNADTQTAKNPNVTTTPATSEAGIVRGVARSVGRISSQKGISMVKLPTVGRLPVTNTKPPIPSLFRGPKVTTTATTPRPTTSIIPKRISVKQVAKVSDHVSQGISLLDSASDVSDSSAKQKGPTKKNIHSDRLQRMQIFASSLMKNTILGISVFEVYNIVVDSFAHKYQLIGNDVRFQQDPITSQKNKSTQLSMEVPISVHTFGGLMGGCAHGTIATVWDAVATSGKGLFNQSVTLQRSTVIEVVFPSFLEMYKLLPKMVVHHGFSHAVLFGSYEALKRQFLSMWLMGTSFAKTDITRGKSGAENDVDRLSRLEHLFCIFLAGGFAGQVQHMASYYSERSLLNPTIDAPWTKPMIRNLILPLSGTFFASGIGFVAFEYGRSINS